MCLRVDSANKRGGEQMVGRADQAQQEQVISNAQQQVEVVQGAEQQLARGGASYLAPTVPSSCPANPAPSPAPADTLFLCIYQDY